MRSTKKKKRKKRPKLIPIKRLQKKAEDIFKKVCIQRDGLDCQVKKLFPHIEVKHSSVLQVDHCITRKNKHFFIDTRNGTVVCSSCNMLKSVKVKSIDRAIDDIVIEREGKAWFDYMKRVDQTFSPNRDWGNRQWLEDKIKELKYELVA